MIVELLLTSVLFATEAEYVNAFCEGEIEVRLPDRTRIDCVEDGKVMEYDFARKWAECFGQALHYGAETGKPAVCVLILKKVPKDCMYYQRLVDDVTWWGLPIEVRTVGGDC